MEHHFLCQSRRRAGVVLLSSVALIAASGCRSWFVRERPALTPPALQLHVEHFAGTALSGPQASSVDVADAWGVAARVIAIESTTPAGFDRIGPQARLVIGPQTGTVVSPSARLIYSTLIRPLTANDDLDASLGEPRSRAVMQSLDAALVPGATASIDIALPDETPSSVATARRSFRIQLSRRANDDAYDLAIVSDDLGTSSADAATLHPSREVIVLQRSLVDGADRFALAIPMTFPLSSARTVVVELNVNAQPQDAAVAGMKVQIEASSAAVAAQRTAATPLPEELAIARSLDALGSSGASPRGTLSFIAERTGAKLTQAVVLVADDRLLQLIAGDVQGRLAQLAARDRRSVAWLLDRSTIESLASVKEENAATVLPPIQGALSIYAGEAGRQLDVLRSLAGEATSSDDLYNRIVAEHVILLEESSPGLRVRAYDWLNAAGRAPAGYDPLGTPQQRRAALERARAASTQPTTNQTATP